MSININHNSGKISTSDKDLKLDAEGLDNNISAQTNRIVNVVDPVDDQDAVTKIYYTRDVKTYDVRTEYDAGRITNY